MARANRPRARGVPSSVPTLMAPADSPNTRDVRGIAAEGRDVLPHPGERRDLIEQTRIGRRVLRFALERRQMQEAERAEPVVDRHHHDVAAPGEARAVVDGLRSRAGGEGAAVEPDQHRPATRASAPGVQTFR